MRIIFCRFFLITLSLFLLKPGNQSEAVEIKVLDYSFHEDENRIFYVAANDAQYMVYHRHIYHDENNQSWPLMAETGKGHFRSLVHLDPTNNMQILQNRRCDLHHTSKNTVLIETKDAESPSFCYEWPTHKIHSSVPMDGVIYYLIKRDNEEDDFIYGDFFGKYSDINKQEVNYFLSKNITAPITNGRNHEGQIYIIAGSKVFYLQGYFSYSILYLDSVSRVDGKYRMIVQLEDKINKVLKIGILQFNPEELFVEAFVNNLPNNLPNNQEHIDNFILQPEELFVEAFVNNLPNNLPNNQEHIDNFILQPEELFVNNLPNNQEHIDNFILQPDSRKMPPNKSPIILAMLACAKDKIGAKILNIKNGEIKVYDFKMLNKCIDERTTRKQLARDISCRKKTLSVWFDGLSKIEKSSKIIYVIKIRKERLSRYLKLLSLL